MKRYIKANRWPDYEKIRGAQRFLDSQDRDKIDLVNECRRDILGEYSKFDYHGENPIGPRVSGVLRDWKSVAAEDWADLTVEEADELFDKIMDALDVIHADEAAAWI